MAFTMMTLDMCGGMKMILIDYNQISISNLMAELNKRPTDNIDFDLVRHMILNTIRGYRKRWHDEFGEVVIACDNRRYWRRQVFPNYKASRKKTREDSGYDWNTIFECLGQVKSELDEFMPYPVIDVDGAEADDVIGTLAEYSQLNDLDQDTLFDIPKPFLIISADHDFQQLQKWENVKQWSPMRKKFVEIKDNPSQVLMEHIISGDKGDGVPNILSDDDVFTEGKRQRPIRKTLVAEWKTKPPEEWVTGDMAAGYIRNKKMVDLSQTPPIIKDEIILQYELQCRKNRSEVRGYFERNNLNRLLESVDDF